MSPVFSQPLAPLKAHSHRSQVYWTLTTPKATSLGGSEWAILSTLVLKTAYLGHAEPSRQLFTEFGIGGVAAKAKE